MKILITGSTGFIGSASCTLLLKKGNDLIGVDNLYKYYDPELKKARLLRHIGLPGYTHVEIDIEDKKGINDFKYVLKKLKYM